MPRFLYRQTLFALVMLLTATTTAWSDETDNRLTLTQQSRPLAIAFTEFPPFFYSDDQGEPKGFLIRKLKLVMDDIGMEYELLARPANRLYHQLRLGELDIWLGITGVESLQDYVREVPLPENYNINLHLWYLPGTPDPQGIAGLNRRSLAVIDGFTYGGLLQKLTSLDKNFRLYRIDTHDRALRMLIKRRAEYLLNYERPVLESLRQYPEITLQKHILYMVSSRSAMIM